MPNFTFRLRNFLNFNTQDLRKPQADFVRVIVPAMFVANSLMLSKLARATAPERNAKAKERKPPPPRLDSAGQPKPRPSPRRRDFDSEEHRLSRALVSENLDVHAIERRYHEMIRPYLQEDNGEGVTIQIDETDYQHPRARPNRPRGMQGASKVRDGSKSTPTANVTGTGFSGITIEATLPNGNQVPLAHAIYSDTVADTWTGEHYRSPSQQLSGVLRRVAPLVGRRSWVVADRGYGGHTSFKTFDEFFGGRWMVRLASRGVQGQRHLQDEKSVQWTVETLAASLPLPYTRVTKEKRETLTVRFGLAKVFLKEESSTRKNAFQPQPRALLVAEFNGAPNRFVLLVGEWPGDKHEVGEMLLRQYRLRWRVEESHRQMKDSRGWGFRVEDFRVLSFLGIQRIIFLAMIAMGFMAVLRQLDPEETERLADSAWAPGAVPPDPRYRLVDAIGTHIRVLVANWWRVWMGKRKQRRTPSQAEVRRRMRNRERANAADERLLRRLEQKESA